MVVGMVVFVPAVGSVHHEQKKNHREKEKYKEES